MKKLIFVFAVCLLFMMTAASVKVIAQPSTDINTYVLFALDKLSFKGGNQVAGWGIVFGNIGTNNAAPTNSYVSLEFGTSGFAYMADGYQAVGDHVRGDAGGSFYDLYANKLMGNFDAVIRNLGPVAFTPPIIATASLPVFPFVPNRALTNGAPDLTIPNGGTYTFVPGVPLRDVNIKDHAVVTFGPGVFDMRKVTTGKNVTFIVDKLTVLQIDISFKINDHFLFGAIGTEDTKIYVGAYGLDWSTTPVTNSSHYSEWHATYYSPAGWFDMGGRCNLYGHFWARKISGDPNNNVYLPPPTTFPPPCLPPFSPIVLTNINDYVLFAYDQLEFKGGNLAAGWGYIEGNIGVNNAAPAGHPSFRSLIFGSSGGAFIFDGYQAVADVVRGDAGSSFWDLFANTLGNNFGATIRNLGPIPWTPPIIPLASLPDLGFIPGRALTDLAADLHVMDFDTYTFLPAPFAYRDVRIEDHAIVTFGPGTFDIRDMSIGKNVTIIVDDATVLHIDRTFMNNTDFTFGVGTHSGAKIYVGSFGVADNQKTSFFSKRAEIHANYFAPNGILDIGDHSMLFGLYWARVITGDPSNNVFCETPGGDSPMTSVNPGVKAAGIQISIFPNPAVESFTLRINNSISQGSILTLQDLTGKAILNTELQLQEGISNYPVSIAGITPGVYIVRLQTATGVGQTKIIINR